jgi:dihydroxycyclohexadiene carboxylate dehydrogenase
MRHHPDRFKGKVAVVTGAAQGIGQMVAVNLAKEGGRVALIDRSEIVNETCEDIVKEGLDGIAIEADLEKYGDCDRVMHKAVKHFGRIDILINNVGGTIWARPFVHYEENQIEAEIRRSLFPTMWCCRAVLPIMVKQNSGTIVNVSSIATRGINRVPYAAAKGGVNALTASLAFECAEQNIRVCAVAPGGTEAPPRRVPRNLATKGALSAQEKKWWREVEEQTKSSSLMKRYGTLEEQAASILFFASDEASYITGLTLPVGGGDLG